MDILAGIVGQALRMIGYLVGFGHAGVIAAAAMPLFPVVVESCDQGGARAAWALKNRSL